ncbi:hypothetical protein GCM10009564_12100 [Streptomyces thermogriseus]|uniref:Uncharacterized protein n=1 Tax=Streptomyces thermogriseus TaxID=75292 RepID=A0ABN1SV55_9ACTN
MTVTDASARDAKTPPPPPPATIGFAGKYGKNPLAEASSTAVCRRPPSVLAHTARMAWAVDRTGVVPLLGCRLPTGAMAAVVLTFTARAMPHLLGTGTVSERLHGALPALAVVTAAAGLGRIGSALSGRVDRRTLAAAPRTLRIALAAGALGGVFLLGSWAALA